MLTLSLALVVLTITVILAARGWSFYWMSIQDRPEHPDFRTLRPSGMLGAGYGWIAALLIVLNLSYLVRRRLGGTRFGSMAVWLDVHVFTGLMIASLVSFHSAFQLRTPIATTLDDLARDGRASPACSAACSTSSHPRTPSSG